MASQLNIQVASLLKLIDKKIGDCYMKDTIDLKDIIEIHEDLRKANCIMNNIIKIKNEDTFSKDEMDRLIIEINALQNKIDEMDLKQNRE